MDFSRRSSYSNYRTRRKTGNTRFSDRRTNSSNYSNHSNYSNYNRDRGENTNSRQTVRQGRQELSIPPELGTGELRVVPLGGQGELGKNSWIFETKEEILIVDSGKSYAPYNLKGGVETFTNNREYLKANKEKIKALLISNPHEEYSGDLINLIEDLEITEVHLPSLVANFWQENLESKKVKINIISSNKENTKISEDFSFKAYKSSFVSADSFCLLIKIKEFKVFYTSGFKITHYSPIEGNNFELNSIAHDLSRSGVDLLISSSQGVEKLGYSKSESDLAERFKQIFFEQADKRIIIVTGCSYTHRFRLLLDAAKKYRRKVCFVGEEINRWLLAMLKSNYISEQEFNSFLKTEDLLKAKPEEVLIIVAEEEGRGIKPFLELSYRRHPDFDLEKDDVVIISIDPSLGTTRLIANAVDQTFLQGVKVIGGRDALVQTGAYACQEELKFMYNLTKPRFFLPANGEVRQIVTHGWLLCQSGLNPKQVIILENGNLLDFNLSSPEKYSFSGQIPNIAVSSSKEQGVITEESLKERFSLAEDGLLNVYLSVDFQERAILAGPELEIFASPLKEDPRWGKTKDLIKQEVHRSVKFCFERNQSVSEKLISRVIKESLLRIVRKISGMNQPVISVIVQAIN